MKLKIKYEVDSSVALPCIASTHYKGKYVIGVGRTWDEATARCIANAKELDRQPPPPQEVEA